MRAAIRATIILAAAAGFCVALASASSADVVEPRSASQPAAVGLLESEDAKAAAKADAAAEEKRAADAKNAKDAKDKELKDKEKAKSAADAVATPAPEQVVRQVPAHLADSVAEPSAPSVVERVVGPLRIGFQQLGASLGRVVSACEVGFSTGAGGPVLVLAVLGIAAPFIRRRVIATRWTTDEDAPDFLYVWELTPPG